MYHDKELAKVNYYLHMFCVITSILEIVVKVIVFFVLFASNSKNRATGLADNGYDSGQNL